MFGELAAGGRHEAVVALAAVVCSPVLFAAHVLLLRLVAGAHHLLLMLVGFAVYAACAYVLAVHLLAGGAVLQPSCLAVWAALCVTCLLVYAEAYSMICRGFSLHIVVELHRRGSMSLDEVCGSYGGGRGVDWLLDKRVSGLLALGMVRRAGDRLEICSQKGRLAAHMGLVVKRILRLGAGG